MKISLRVAALATLLSVAGTSLSAAVPPKRDLSEVAGVVHVSAKYRLPFDGVNESSLQEGVGRISLMGSRAIKLWLSPNVFRSYLNFNGRTDWPTTPYSDPVDVLEAADYKAALDNPAIKVYALTYYPFYTNFAITDGLSAGEQAAVSTEVRAIADYLYETYGSTDKVFIIQNWEGDNDLNLAPKPPELWTARLNDFQSYIQTRQNAVSASRAAHPTSTCRVYCAFEVNQIPTPETYSFPTLVDNVVPNIQCDLYSYSSWSSAASPAESAELVAKVAYLRSKAPTGGILGSDNLMIGEYGAYEQVWFPAPKTRHDGTSDSNLAKSVTNQLTYSLAEGARYTFSWQILASGIRTDANVSPRYTAANYPYANPIPLYYEELMGTWLIRPAAPPEYPAPTFTTAYDNLSRLMHRYIYRDPLTNLTNTFGYTAGLGITTSTQTWDEADHTRLLRNASGEQRVSYSVTDGSTSAERLVDWSIKVFVKGTVTASSRLAFSTSAGGTGAVWTTSESFGETASLDVGGGYTRLILTPPTGYTAPSDARFLRIHFLDSGAFADTQISSVTFFTEKPQLLSDPLDNFSNTLTHSANLAIATSAQSWTTDTARLYRTNNGPASVTYFAPIVDGFALTVYHKNPIGSQLEVAISHDGNSDQWEVIPWNVSTASTTLGWTTSTVVPASALPVGRSVVRIRLLGGTTSDYFAPQLGKVDLSCQRDTIPD